MCPWEKSPTFGNLEHPPSPESGRGPVHGTSFDFCLNFNSITGAMGIQGDQAVVLHRKLSITLERLLYRRHSVREIDNKR